MFQAELVWINSAEENLFLGSLHEDKEETWFWIGAKRNEDDMRSFLWTDGTALSQESWNNNNEISGGDCGISGLGDGSVWSQENCSSQGSFICEKSLSSSRRRGGFIIVRQLLPCPRLIATKVLNIN